MKARASWNESQATCRAMTRPLGSGLPSQASTQPDLARRNGEEFDPLDPVLQGHRPKCSPGVSSVGLITGLAIQGNDAAIRQLAVLAEGKLLRHDPDAVIRNHDDATQPEDRSVGNHQEDDPRRDDQAGMCVPQVN